MVSNSIEDKTSMYTLLAQDLLIFFSDYLTQIQVCSIHRISESYSYSKYQYDFVPSCIVNKHTIQYNADNDMDRFGHSYRHLSLETSRVAKIIL